MDKIASIIVLYNPNFSAVHNIKAALLQSDCVILVDNGSSKEILESIQQVFLNDRRVSFISNGQNLGIAAALNVGVRRAKELGVRWIATFDQDSTVSPGYMDALLQSYYLFPDNNRVRIISPLYKDTITGKIISAGTNTVYMACKHDSPFELIDSTITSGNLIDSRLFDEIGYFDDLLFIDMVDHDFCLRCVGEGYKILETAKAVLGHNLGSPKKFKIFGKQGATTNHSPIRRYYMIRNRFYIYKKHHKNRKWIFKDISIFFGRDIPKLILFDDNRKEKLLMLVIGICDGLNNRMGRKDD